MKKIEEGIYTLAHNLVFVDKGYDFLSLFLKGNKTVLNGSNINKIHIFLGFSTSTFRMFDMLNELSAKSKAMIIIHTCTEAMCRNLNTFIMNNNQKVNFRYDFHKNKEQYELNDDAGKLIVYPYTVIKDKDGNRTIKRKMTMTNKKKGCKNK